MSPELSRRRLFELAGLTSLGGVLAACGASSSGGEPGRVGNAVPIEPLPTVEVTDVVILRTMTSMEYLLLDLYQTLKDLDLLDERGSALVDRFVEDHRAAAEQLATMTEQAGGEPYTCANDWYTRRIVPDILATVTGDEAQGIAPSDEPASDVLRISYAFESMTSSAYHKMIELVTEPALRPPMAQLGAIDARHSAAVAMLMTGTPEGYVSPVVLGQELTPGRERTGPAVRHPIPVRVADGDGARHRRTQRGRHPIELRRRDAGRQRLRLRRRHLPRLTRRFPRSDDDPVRISVPIAARNGCVCSATTVSRPGGRGPSAAAGGSRKVGTPQGRVLARARSGRPDGSVQQRADRRWTGRPVTGEGETVR